MKKALQLIYGGSRVKRFHTTPTVATHTVGQHSFGVVALVMLMDPAASKELLVHALLHDVAEVAVGDIPAPVKRSLPGLKIACEQMEQQAHDDADLALPEITDAEHRVLKLADYMDGMMSCVHERTLGNKSQEVKVVYWNYRSYVDALKPVGVEFELYQEIGALWRDAK